MKIFVKQLYTAVACNRTPEIVDWNKEGLICYGASNAVVIYNTNLKGRDPLTVLSHHQSRVNSVKWLTKPGGLCTELISASADKTAVIWTLENGQWKVNSVLEGHSDGITSIYGMYTGGNDLFVFTSSIDSTVRVWERSNGTVTLKQIINLNSGLCLTLHALMLPVVNKPILFLGLDDNKIHVFALNGEYHRVDVLIGHEDWVRGMDSIIEDNTILLASASQDTYIRIWRIQRFYDEPSSSSQVSGIKVEKKVFDAYDVVWSVKLEAVLAGHEGWVYGVQWDSFSEKDNKRPIHRLLSSSLDKTIIIWEPEKGGAWVEKIRVGEVGGNGLGFYGSRFGPSAFMGHGYNGSFHIWKIDKELKTCESSIVVGGHFSGVEDVQWETKGRYLLSASLDQTARLHAPWKVGQGIEEWHEIARPQVHGYDLCSLAPLGAGLYASAAEEKVIRVFQAPGNFICNFQNITGQELEAEDAAGPEGASVPSLGLSNKAVFSGDDIQNSDADNDGYFVPIELHEPPTEETLMQNTLWPEAQKLYGHGYEVYCVAGSPDGSLLASACKATTAQHAAVLIWETNSWQQIQKLVSHQLTVTQLAFSPDSRHLLSVSRDRRWTLFTRESGLFSIAASTDKTNGVHSRIIWCCAWLYDGSGFGTGSRDGKVCLWSKTDTTTDSSLKDYALLGKPLELSVSVTALAFAPTLKSRIAAVGLETGVIQIYIHDDTWTILHELDNSSAHHLTVKRLSFKPRTKEDKKREFVLASCGCDHFVRIHSIAFDTVQT
ncbi:elongator complex protein 2 isoform X1 [Pieris napi]|uniref:elongator complex protein 2 isoform X1 n=1 Tax=Pieris napi TaxID=78633 RepID=UPI001FB87249|nr:elongator complex protein 2 isoform X1 [Pieris napi]